jgi:flagellin-like protein
LLPLTYTITPKGGIERKMKILKSKKALSPVVASIILIAVTVAVSIAVAAWMGSLTTGMQSTENLNIIDVRYDSTAKKVYIDLSNSGSSTVTINDARVDGTTYANFNSTSNGVLDKTLPYDLVKGNTVTFTITFTTWPFRSGVYYQFTILTSKGNLFGPYQKAAPT